MTLPQGKATAGAEVLQQLKKSVGSAIVELALGADIRTINRQFRDQAPQQTETIKVLNLLAYIWETLTLSLSVKDAKLWLVSHSEYLYGIPIAEIRSRPEDVYLAALNRVSRGERLENLHGSDAQ